MVTLAFGIGTSALLLLLQNRTQLPSCVKYYTYICVRELAKTIRGDRRNAIGIRFIIPSTTLFIHSYQQRNLFAVFELLFGIVLNFAQGFPDRDAGDKFRVSTEGRCNALKLVCATGIIPFLSSSWEFRFIRIFAIRSLGLAWDAWISHVQFKEWEAHWHATTEQKAGLEHQLDILQSSFSGGNEGPFQRIDDTHLSFLVRQVLVSPSGQTESRIAYNDEWRVRDDFPFE